MDVRLQNSILKRIDKLTKRITKDLKELGKLREEVATGMIHVPKSASSSPKTADMPLILQTDYYDEDSDPMIHIEGKPDENLYTQKGG